MINLTHSFISEPEFLALLIRFLVSMNYATISLSFDVKSSRMVAMMVTVIELLVVGNIIAHKGHIGGITSAATLCGSRNRSQHRSNTVSVSNPLHTAYFLNASE